MQLREKNSTHSILTSSSSLSTFVLTHVLTLRLPPVLHDLLTADLSDLGFDSFESEGELFKAYGPSENWTPELKREIEQWLIGHQAISRMEREVLPDQNWNAKWEASIQPLPVGSFLIRPSWHDVPDEFSDRIVLEIDPKMSFGTGYHPSTRLAIQLGESIVTGGERILDAGCGTGILALAALKLGASSAIGFDIDDWARDNAYENAERNGLLNKLEVRQGSIDCIPETGFELIFANINRHILVDFLPEMKVRLAPDGRIILAGLLFTDRHFMADVIRKNNLEILAEAREGDWWACTIG